MHCYCLNNLINYADPSVHFSVLTAILCGLALVGMRLTIGGVATYNNVMPAIGLTMIAVPVLISGVGAIVADFVGVQMLLASGIAYAKYLSIF